MMEQMNIQLENRMTQHMNEFKIEFSEFFKGFSTNYTQELSRNSLSPLMREIDILKTVQNENIRANTTHQSQ
jgi:hypothetical protein